MTLKGTVHTRLLSLFTPYHHDFLSSMKHKGDIGVICEATLVLKMTKKNYHKMNLKR